MASKHPSRWDDEKADVKKLVQSHLSQDNKKRANRKPRVLICDGFGTHETLEVLEFCFENSIILCRLPSHTPHIAVFGPLKAAYHDEAERQERGGVNAIGKEHFTSLYGPAGERALTKRNILAGWAKSGLFRSTQTEYLDQRPTHRLQEWSVQKSVSWTLVYLCKAK